MSMPSRSAISPRPFRSVGIVRSPCIALLFPSLLILYGCRESPRPRTDVDNDSSSALDGLHAAESVETSAVGVAGIDIIAVEIDSVGADGSPPFQIDISYPKAVAPSGTEKLAAFNDEVRRTVESITASFLEQVDDFQPEDDLGTSSSLSLRYDVAMINPRCISLELIVDEYYAGAAHPNARSITMNYDVERSSLLTIASLFDDDSTMLARISELTSQHLRGIDDMDSVWVAEGTKAIEENFETFLLTPSNLVILFNTYQVAPYAMGPQRVGIPWKTVGADAYRQVRHLFGVSRTKER